MKLIRPISEKKRMELEQELEQERRRFLNASQQAASRIRHDLTPIQWIKGAPMMAALMIGAFGFASAQMLKKRRSELPRIPPSRTRTLR